MKPFSYDNWIMTLLSKIFDVFFLNMLTLIFSIPLVTIGAATTAAHYTALKIHREEGHVWTCFWKSFRENFKQSTGIWLIVVAYSAITIAACLAYNNMDGTIARVGQGVIIASMILFAFVYTWVIPLQSKFVNTIRTTFKNAFYMAFRYFFRTLLMLILGVLPLGLLVVIVFVLRFRGLVLMFMFGISLPIYWCALLYDKIFEELETMILENQQLETE